MFSAKEVKIGVAPINWSNDDLPELGGHISFETCIKEMQEARFEGCEVGNKFPRDPYILKDMLAERNLQVCNQWFSFTLSTEPLSIVKERFIALLEFLRVFDVTVVGGGEVGTSIQGKPLPLFEAKPNNSLEQWRNISVGLEELGKISKEEYGISLCFHPHLGTCIQTMEETELLLDSTDPDTVFINYDCGHIYASGDDPLACLQKIGNRVRHVHLKDVRKNILDKVKDEHLSFLDGVKRGLFTIPSDGDIQCIPQIIQELAKLRYKGWLVIEAEQDPSLAPPLEFAKRSREFIYQHTGL